MPGTTRVGTTKKYADNWENIFGGRKKSSTTKPVSKSVKKKTVSTAKKSAKKKGPSKAAGRGKKKVRRK